MMGTAELKVEAEAERCAVCDSVSDELLAPEEYDAGAPQQPPLRAMLLHLARDKTVPSGRLCTACIRKTLDAYSFSTMLASKGPPPLSEKIRSLRQRLQELTQKIDVFIVVGGEGEGAAYSEDDIIVVERAALRARPAPAPHGDARGLPGYQCAVCPQHFTVLSEYRAHVSSHPAGSVHNCWWCGAQFGAPEALHAHSATHDLELVCHLCGAAFQSGAALAAHEGACPWRCAECDVTFPSRAALAAHAAARHPATCGACWRRLPSAAARRFVCGYDACILRFGNRAQLMSHVRKSHGAPPAAPAPPPAPATACLQCDRTFASVAAMKRHARVHRDTRPRDTENEEWTMDGAEEEYLELETLDDMDDQ